MSIRPVRIATTAQLERSCREAGYQTFVVPEPTIPDFNRPLEQRVRDGAAYRQFLDEKDIDLLVDFNTGTMTFVPSPTEVGKMSLTTAALGIPYVALYLDPVTATMGQVGWPDHWQILENPTWIKGIWEFAHAEELQRLGVPNIVRIPMAATHDDFPIGPAENPDPQPLVAFMGHPATTWLRSNQPLLPGQLQPGLIAAAVHADMPDLAFHKIFFDLYQLGEPPAPGDDFATRARKSNAYFNAKFVYNAYLAVKQRDRWARFLKLKLGDKFELVGDHWQSIYGLPHTPRIWDMKVLHERMRQVPICLNLIKGSTETGLIIRHFEATAFGCFLLTYPTPELSQFFKIGEECDIFRDEQELLDKIAYYIANPKIRAEIARNGQQRTLREHLYSNRITALVNHLRQTGLIGGPVPATHPRERNVADLTAATLPNGRTVQVAGVQGDETAAPATAPVPEVSTT